MAKTPSKASPKEDKLYLAIRLEKQDGAVYQRVKQKTGLSYHRIISDLARYLDGLSRSANPDRPYWFAALLDESAKPKK